MPDVAADGAGDILPENPDATADVMLPPDSGAYGRIWPASPRPPHGQAQMTAMTRLGRSRGGKGGMMEEGPPPPGRTWDYYTLPIDAPCSAVDVDFRLNEAGAAGWELVQMLTGAKNGDREWVIAVFKRTALVAPAEGGSAPPPLNHR